MGWGPVGVGGAPERVAKCAWEGGAGGGADEINKYAIRNDYSGEGGCGGDKEAKRGGRDGMVMGWDGTVPQPNGERHWETDFGCHFDLTV